MEPPALVLALRVDMGLPGMKGHEVARRARQQRDMEKVVLVALTGYGHEEDRQLALAAGFDHHLAKPIDKSGEYRLYSRTTDPRTGRRKTPGTFKTRAAPKKHERAVQYFKRR